MRIPDYISKPDELMDLIAIALDRKDIQFSKAVAAKIVGGEYRLEKLVLNGKIRMEKPTARQNGKWFCNGGDVMRHMAL